MVVLTGWQNLAFVFLLAGLPARQTTVSVTLCTDSQVLSPISVKFGVELTSSTPNVTLIGAKCGPAWRETRKLTFE